MVTKINPKETVIEQDYHQPKSTMASEISYTSLKIARQVRESVSTFSSKV
jgi:hypothetical protein